MAVTFEDRTRLEPIGQRDLGESILDRWRTVVQKMGASPAVSSAGVSYTFSEADALSDGVASQLAGSLPSGSLIVGALFGHDAAAVIGFLALMKARHTIVMLDPHLPAERLRDIIALAGVSAIVADKVNSETAAEVSPSARPALSLEQLLENAQSGTVSPRSGARAIVGRNRCGRDAVSIVFTSGSTGRPKGVVHTHGQLMNDSAAHAERFRLSGDDRIAMVLPIGFSAGLSLVFIALLNGAGLWLYDPRDGGTRGLTAWINTHQLTTLHCTPHLLRSLTTSLGAGSGTVFSSLRVVATVGEAIYGQDVEAIREHLNPSTSFFNWSGSSEIGTLALFELPGDAPVPVGTIPAGRPVVNKEVVLLREDQSVAEAGEAGDIVVLSDYLSGGYWADEAANDARFGLSSTGQRLCRQGDLGRFDANGDLILLGRTDTAVKVRGYLVEPSEIEAALLATGEIEEAVVVPVVAPPAMTRLIAYVVPLPGTRSPAPAALRRELRTRLPEYMIPAAILLMPTLPRNERGKVDRTLLPLVPESGATTETMDPRQRVVAGIWCTILGLNSVGLDDDFMALGGDSLSAEELMATVAEQFQVPLVSSDLMEFPTLREFTRRITMGAANLPRHPDVITLHAGGDETPLFCFAGSGALALTFLPLSRHFPERPVYAFQAHGLEKRGIPDWSVPASARRFLETIRILRPRGPYLLVGHSFGGLVALEIARQLTEAGESVELVGLLDTYFPSSSGQLPTLAFATLPPAVPGVVARTLSRVHRNPRRSTPSGRSVLRLSARRLRAVAAGIIVYSGQRQFDVFFDHGIIASHRYQVPRYQGKTLFAITHDNPDREAWEKILPPSAPILEFPSEHTAMLREPHATSLAALIHAHLDDPATE